MKESAVHSESFILLTDTVRDLDDFVAHPDRYLVSVFDEPERSAAIWCNRRNLNLCRSDGFLALSYRGVDLIPATLWDEVAGIWFELVGIVEEFMQKGLVERLFPGQSIPIRLEVKGRSTLFTLGQQKTVVDPLDFIPGILDEAHRYYTWVDQYLGTFEGHTIGFIDSLRNQFHVWKYAH